MENLPPRKFKKLEEDFLSKCDVKLIFGVDLQSSTALKAYGQVNTDEPWVLAFEIFYEYFPKVLIKAYESMPPCLKDDRFKPSDNFRVLKFLGDQIIFQVTLKRHEEILSHILAAKTAVANFNSDEKHYKNLRCKPAAWLASFPVINSQVTVQCPADNKTPCAVDYIGPHMDCGFRIANYSTPWKLVVSFDLVEMVIHALDKLPLNFRTIIKFYYDGSKPLAGVLNESPYPIIWIEIFDNDTQLEEKLKGIDRKPCQRQDLEQFINDFKAKHKILYKWFIKGDKDPHYSESIVDWVKRYNTINQKRLQIKPKI